MKRSLNILLVEDNEGDVELTQAAFDEAGVPTSLQVASDGEEVLDILYQRGECANEPLPDLILLDLNLPKISGREVLGIIKKDKDLSMIPVVVLSSSGAQRDISDAYRLHANCYMIKSMNWKDFVCSMGNLGNFWLNTVRLCHE